MNTSKLKLYTGVICLSLLLPASSQAYFSTAQSATKLNSDTTLFTVTYRFGLQDRELYMPIIARRNGVGENEPFVVKYAILDEGSEIKSGTTAGIVFTNDKDVEIRNGQYYLPAGKSAEFTLNTILSTKGIEPDTESELSLLVKSLPFTMVDKGEPIPAKLNPSELKYYRTPAVTI
jgi:hypothetical protein